MSKGKPSVLNLFRTKIQDRTELNTVNVRIGQELNQSLSEYIKELFAIKKLTPLKILTQVQSSRSPKRQLLAQKHVIRRTDR